MLAAVIAFLNNNSFDLIVELLVDFKMIKWSSLGLFFEARALKLYNKAYGVNKIDTLAL